MNEQLYQQQLIQFNMMLMQFCIMLMEDKKRATGETKPNNITQFNNK